LDFLRRHKKAFISVITAMCVLAAALTFGERYAPTVLEKALGYVVTPVQAAFTAAGNWVSERVDFLVHMNELSVENELLRAQNELYSAEISRLKLVDQENERLSDLLNTDRRYQEYPRIGAKIIAKDVGNWYQTFTIDRGTKDGLQKNMVVLAAGGLCGRVSEVWYSSATVVALIDDTFSVSAQGSRTGDTGIVRGDIALQLEGKCRMDFIDAEAKIVEGDEIVTSQLSSMYPPGITIGTVLSVSRNTNGTQSAIIQPTVNFTHMSNVFVITEIFEHNMQSTSEVLQETAKQYAELDLLSADVLARRDPVHSGFVMNRGAKHGVTVGTPVLAIGGLAGHVAEVGYDYAVVKSILDNDLPVPVTFASSGALGLLRRDAALLAEGCCLLEVLSPDAKVEIGDELIISAAVDSVYPAGVTVGYVASILPAAGGASRVVVRAAVDFKFAASVLYVAPVVPKAEIPAEQAVQP